MKVFYKKTLTILIASIIFMFIVGDLIHVGDNNYTYVDYQILYDLDYPQTQLNNHSLREVFDNSTSLLSSSQLVTNGDFSNGTTGWTTNNIGTPLVMNGVVSFTATAQYGNLRQLSISATSNDKLYINVYYNPSSLIQRVQVMRNGSSTVFNHIPTSTGFQVISGVFSVGTLDTYYPEVRVIEYGTLFSSISVDYLYIFNISTLITNKQYSPMFNTTFDLMTDDNIKLQMDAWVQAGISNVTLLSYADVLTYAPDLTVSQMEYWYQVYNTLKGLEA